jgi:CO/xanthine dehydrogenase Mo-binding subunit
MEEGSLETTTAIGKSVIRKDAMDKATGTAKFNSDVIIPGILHAKLVTSRHAHARIKSIDISQAQNASGVQAVITGEYTKGILTGTFLEDRPIMAVGKVRYFGEPIAVVVAATEMEAMKAVNLVKVEYEPLPVVNSPGDALKPDAPLVHGDMEYYRYMKEVFPTPGTNIANHVKIRKGDMEKGWAESEVIVEENFVLPQSDHAAIEMRSVRAQIKADGQIILHTPSQAPFIIRKKLSRHFGMDPGTIIVHTPFVGGAFGGKAAVQLELIAYLASKAVNGREVILTNSREEDMVSSPCRIGLQAKIKFGASKDGRIRAAELTYLVDTGAYSDMGAVMTKAIASDCTGPYNIENVWCDSICTYTNHTYVASFRGFGHGEYTLAIERTMDKLAAALGMDQVELRLKNAVVPGDTSPTQSDLTGSNMGNLPQCIRRLKEMINWEEGTRVETGSNKVKAKGISCFWKTSTTPPDAVSGAVVTFTPSGHANLSIGAVELGQGTKTTLAQILAEKLKLDINRVTVTMEVNTQENPEHWKTVASSSNYMVGNAIVAAADDAIRQIKEISAVVLRCSAEDLEVAGGKVFEKDNPQKYIDMTEVIHGYKYPNGNSIGGQVIGRGSFIMKHLTGMDEETGRGAPGPLWTLGAQAVEVELDTKEYTYRVIKAASVIDAGKIINPAAAKSIVMGGMSMGLSLTGNEAFLYDKEGIMQNPQFRTYKLMRYDERPEYLVDFIETPEKDGPYGARGLGEHGLVGIPAALINSLSTAAQTDLNRLPLTPESIWRKKTGRQA